MEINVGYTHGAITSGVRAAHALLKKNEVKPTHKYSDLQVYL